MRLKPRSNTVIAIINALQRGDSTEKIAASLGVSKSRIYNIRHKLKQQRKEKVRAYVRKTPKHPEKLQKVGPYVRGGKKPRKPKANSFTEIPQSTKFVPPRSLDLADALIKNQDLFNEVKDQQAIIRYLEGLVVRLMKSN